LFTTYVVVNGRQQRAEHEIWLEQQAEEAARRERQTEIRDALREELDRRDR
jgi:hypothetical protein